MSHFSMDEKCPLNKNLHDNRKIARRQTKHVKWNKRWNKGKIQLTQPISKHQSQPRRREEFYWLIINTLEENMTADTMDLSALQDQIDALSAQITKQGAEVRTLKKADATDADAISAAVEVLQNLKIDHKKLVDQMEEASGGSDAFNRQVFDDLVLRKMFVIPSFEIHGGVKGLFDLGPPACALKVSSFAWYFFGFAWVPSSPIFIYMHFVQYL
jgi:SMC interacting uncharacterized protein involved in chromosome segregation